MHVLEIVFNPLGVYPAWANILGLNISFVGTKHFVQRKYQAEEEQFFHFEITKRPRLS